MAKKNELFNVFLKLEKIYEKNELANSLQCLKCS